MIIAVDFDGTIVEHEFPLIGRPVPGALPWLRKFAKAGARLILWTMRSDGQQAGDVLTAAIEYCKAGGVEFWGVNHNPEQDDWTTSHKAYAHLYIDDAAFGCPCRTRIGRPFVDWSKVGPFVMKMLKDENEQLKRRKLKEAAR